MELLRAFPGSRVFAFYGKMGAGKTTFIKAICHHLGAADIVQSPSFAIINEYRTHTGDSLFHFDFYRIKDPKEIYELGFEEYFYSDSHVFIEWPENIGELLPSFFTKLHISVKGTDTRSFVWEI